MYKDGYTSWLKTSSLIWIIASVLYPPVVSSFSPIRDSGKAAFRKSSVARGALALGCESCVFGWCSKAFARGLRTSTSVSSSVCSYCPPSGPSTAASLNQWELCQKCFPPPFIGYTQLKFLPDFPRRNS